MKGDDKLNNTIKEYLVSLGFKVDDQSYGHFMSGVAKATNMVKKFTSSTTGGFVTAGASVTAFFVSANIGIAKFLEGLAKTDLQMEMFARKMWTSKDNAIVFTNALKAMDATIEDLYLSPELLRNFDDLKKKAYELRPPDEYSGQMKGIRSIMFEFQKFKLEMMYGMQWIGYYLTKYLEGPLSKLKLSLKGLNESIQKNMPIWTKKVAEFLSYFVRLGIAGGTAISTLVKLFEKIPTSIKNTGGAFLGLFSLLKMGPFGQIIAALTAILLLIDDFTTYKSGGESQFPTLWKWFEDIGDSDTFKSLSKEFEEFASKVGELVSVLGNDLFELATKIYDLLDAFAKLIGFKDFKTLMQSTIILAFDLLRGSISGVNEVLQILIDLLKGDFSKVADNIKKGLFDMFSIDGKKSPLETIKKSFEAWGNLFSDFSGKNEDKTKGFFKDTWDKIWQKQSMGASDYSSRAITRNVSSKQTITNNFNITGGSDPKLVATAISTKFQDAKLIRSFQGVVI